MEIAPFHPSQSAQVYAGDRHTPTPTASACSCHTTGTAAGRAHTRPPHQQTQPAAGIACGCPSLPGPAASRAPAHAPQSSCPLQQGPTKAAQSWSWWPKRPQALAAVSGGVKSGSSLLLRCAQAPSSPLAWPQTQLWCLGEQESHCLVQLITSTSRAALSFPGRLSSAWPPPTWVPCR